MKFLKMLKQMKVSAFLLFVKKRSRLEAQVLFSLACLVLCLTLFPLRPRRRIFTYATSSSLKSQNKELCFQRRLKKGRYHIFLLYPYLCLLIKII